MEKMEKLNEERAAKNLPCHHASTQLYKTCLSKLRSFPTHTQIVVSIFLSTDLHGIDDIEIENENTALPSANLCGNVLYYLPFGALKAMKINLTLFPGDTLRLNSLVYSINSKIEDTLF